MYSLAIIFLGCLLIPGNLSLRVVVSGYNTQLATYEVSGSELSSTGGWDVGAENHDMTWLQVDGSTVWAGHEVGDYAGTPGSVASRWEVSGDGLTLQLGEVVSTESVYTAHLLVDKEQGMAYAANYGGSSFTAISLMDGKLGEVAYLEGFGEGCRMQATLIRLLLTRSGSGWLTWAVTLCGITRLTSSRWRRLTRHL